MTQVTQLHITVVRGRLKADSVADNHAVHDAIYEPLKALGTSLSAIGHTAYLNPHDPREFLAVDTWTTLEGPQRLFNNPTVAAEFERLFEGQPEITFWSDAGWASFDDPPTPAR